MVRLVQLVEHQIVVLGVVGSSPTSHPKAKDLPAQGGLFALRAAHLLPVICNLIIIRYLYIPTPPKIGGVDCFNPIRISSLYLTDAIWWKKMEEIGTKWKNFAIFVPCV